MTGVATDNRIEEKATAKEHPSSRLEWYLERLLEPRDDAPREPAPQETPNATSRRWEPQPPDAAGRPEQRDGPETPKEPRPPWQNPENESSKAPAAASSTRPAGRKPTIQSYPQKEGTGGGRQKLMMALIPVLAITMIVLLKSPLGARPAAKAASAQPKETAHPTIPDVEIAWQIPSVHEPDGRDPMHLTPPTAGSPQGVLSPAETPIELIVMGILHSDDKPAAIIDTQVVHEGQQVSGATVEKIDKDGVQFERNGRRWKQTVNR
jgi:hypothetical protein